MSRETWDALLTGSLAGLEELSELASLGQQARLARSLAAGEWRDGRYVDETEIEASPQRLAASDQDVAKTYVSGAWRVELSGTPGSWTATLREGEPGASLSVGGGEVPLLIDQPVALHLAGPAPGRLALVTAGGQLVVLES